MNKYLKKYQKTGEVKKLTYTEWCSENNELCRSDANKAKVLYEEYSKAYDMQNWSVSFNQSVSFGDDTQNTGQNTLNQFTLPNRRWGYVQPASVWTTSIGGPVTPLDVLPGIWQMGNAFKELFTPDPYRKAIREEKRRKRKLKKEEYGGSFQWAGETGGNLWDDDSSDDVDYVESGGYGPFEEDSLVYSGDMDQDNIPDSVDADPYNDQTEEDYFENKFEYDDDDDLDLDNDGVDDRGAITDGGWNREEVDNSGSARYSQDQSQNQNQGEGEKKRFWDRKVPKFFRKFSHGLVTAAKPVNAIIRLNQARNKMAKLNYGTIAGNMFASTPADMSGSKGDWTTNEGYFRPDDRIPVRSDFSRYGMEIMRDGGSNEGLNIFIPEASEGTEWLENNYPGYDDLSASEKAQLNYQMKGTTYDFYEDLYNFQNPNNRTGPYSEHTNTMSYPFPEWMRHYDNHPGRDITGRDWSQYNRSWDDNPNIGNYYNKRWSTYEDWDNPGTWGRTENRTQGVWGGHGTTVTDPITGQQVNQKRGPWEGFYSGYSWMPDDPISLSETDWNTLIETGSYDPRRIDKRGRWSRSQNEYINKDADAYMVWEEVLRRNYPELTTMQIHDLMYSGVKRTGTRGGRRGSPWSEAMPTVARMKEDDYQWGEYNDLLFDVRTNMPPGSREPMPIIPNTSGNNPVIASNNTGITEERIEGNTIPNVTSNVTSNVTPNVTSNVTPNITSNVTSDVIEDNESGYIPQSRRTREEMNTLAYGPSGVPQTQQGDTESAYIPQTLRKDEEENDDAKYGGFFYGNGGEAEIDLNTYKQLIAAGADIEIL
jgi:hypothetical protein